MPRGPRLDAPGTAHHVMIRGIERRRIFRGADDYEDFLTRLARLVPELGFLCFAWALMPNHVHLALQTGPVPLPRLMARLGTGYARYFNRRHRRVGHLLQNRYRSRMVTDDRDLLGLVLYIHRNPLEAGLVSGPEALARYPWCGHGALAGARHACPFEAPAHALRLLSEDPVEARRLLGQWMETPPPHLADPQEQTGEDRAVQERPSATGPAASPSLDELIRSVSAAHGLPPDALGRRSRRAVAARAELAQRATTELGLPSRAIARALGVSDSTVSRALARS